MTPQPKAPELCEDEGCPHYGTSHICRGGGEVRKRRKFCVTVMDNWTPTRVFWTFEGARKWQAKHPGYSYLYVWHDETWNLWVGKGSSAAADR